ncbi:MAG: sodium-dependent transporter [Pseudomonadota bacterium]
MSRGVLRGWDSRTTFVLALSASAVGLGNLWRFAWLAGEHGGAPFVLAYVVCLFVVACPILIAEVIIGSHGRGSPVGAIRWAADRSLRSRGWVAVGLFTCLTGYLLLSYQAVVAGWSLAFANELRSGAFSAASAPMVGQYFESLLNAPGEMLRWQTLFLLLMAVVLALGVRRGVGLMVWLSVPALIAILGVLVVFAMDQGDLAATQDFLFTVRMIDFTYESVLAALGHAFFTLGVGVGAGICYGAYAPVRVPIGRSVVAVALFDLVVALAMGLAIFPLVFANNLEPSAGPALLFVSLPYAFGNMIQGELFGFLFFLFVVIAALGSAVAMAEPIVSLIRHWLRCTRFFAVFLVMLAVWFASLAVALSFNNGPVVFLVAGRSLFEFLDWITVQWLLPLASLGLILFVGWRMRPAILREELCRETDLFFSQWLLWLRYIAPPATVVAMLSVALL